jgi:argininosuccinate lyase
MQEDKEAVFDAVDTAKQCLSVLTPMLLSMTVDKTRMLEATRKGFLNATDCADYLVRKGLAFRDAYRIVGELVKHCLLIGQTLDTLPLSDYREHCDAFGEDVYAAIDLAHCVQARDVAGGPAPGRVREQILKVRETLEQMQ